MDDSSDIRKIDTREVARDLINWMDYTDAGWRALEPMAMRELLKRAHLHFEQVARSHRIPESDFRTPLDDAMDRVLREHVS
jgi:hypothetical protein